MNSAVAPPQKPSSRPFLVSTLGFVTYLYLLRFPLLGLSLLVGLPVAAATVAEKMLAGAFDQWLWRQIFALALVTGLAAATLFMTGRLVLDYSSLRGSAPFSLRHRIWRRIWLILAAVSIIPTLVVAYRYSGDAVKPWPFAIFTLFGLACATLILFSISCFFRTVMPKIRISLKGRFVVWLTAALNVPVTDEVPTIKDIGSAVLRSLPEYLTNGYLEKDATGSPRLLIDHAVAFVLAVAFLVVYLVLGAWHSGTAIVYLLVLITTLCWLVSGLAFFLDRYRIPVLLFIGLWLFVAAQSPKSDHYYYLSQRDASYSGQKSAEYILAERPGSQDCRIIVISANGGGIQSAAWTAQVLSGLAQQFQRRGEADLRRFLNSVRLISGVSGGSVGTMFFANAIQPANSANSMSFDDVVEQAESSSLSEVVWGLTYPDFAHAIFPWGRADLILDRGHTLEEAWVKTAKQKTPAPALTQGLLEWNRSVEEGWRPAIIFNSTFAESGERLQISTTPSWTVVGGNPPPGRQEFFYIYNADIRVATAARLSATYPYVSPATRPFFPNGSPVWKDKSKDYGHAHAVDGGYFDNSGLCALTEWLDEALEERDNVHPRGGVHDDVLVLQIRGFPEGENLTFKESRGWFYQLYAPLATLLGVWTSGQANTTATEFQLLQSKWQNRNINIRSIIFEPDATVYQTADGKQAVLPLSWHMRNKDKECIKSAWEKELTKLNVQAVLDYVGRPKI